MKKQVYRIYDRVKIINPEIFIRCGYPLGIQEGLNLITKEEKEKICDLLGYKYAEDSGRISPFSKGELLFNYNDNRLTNQTFDKIVKEFAYFKIRSLGFGGKERRVRTKREEDLAGVVATIYGKRVVRSGDYYHGFSLEYDYEPAGIDKVKSHVILNVGYAGRDFEIEEIHVEKVGVNKEDLIPA